MNAAMRLLISLDLDINEVTTIEKVIIIMKFGIHTRILILFDVICIRWRNCVAFASKPVVNAY